MSDADRQTLIERVTIVIHAAASVKFNDSLKQTILNNTRSVRDVCMLAENMKNLVVRVLKYTIMYHVYTSIYRAIVRANNST